MPHLDSALSHEAHIYVRPHLLDVHGTAGDAHAFAAQLRHISAAGPLVRLELTAEWGEAVRVEMPQERFRTRGLQRGQRVFVSFEASDLFVSPETWGDAADRTSESPVIVTPGPLSVPDRLTADGSPATPI